MSEGKTGDLVECIMGLGFLYQTHKCEEMEGIVELVMFLEDTLQMNGAPEGTEQEETEGITVSTAEFQEAISGIEKKIDKLMDMNNKRTQYGEDMEYIRETMHTMMSNMKEWT
eukprot:11581411-Heterocapsa_arctica.AAC.1